MSKGKKQALRKFLNKEIKKIEEYKWIESEKVGHDLGREAVEKWAELFAKKYRQEYIDEDLLKATIKGLAKLRESIKDESMMKIIDDCIENIEDALELEESK